jgi:hypothetical protein
MTTRTLPLVAAAICAAVVAVPPGAGAVSSTKGHQCGGLTANNGAQVKFIVATRIGCTTGKAVARRASGKPSYKAFGFVCHSFGPSYICTKTKQRAVIAFGYKKRS